MPHGRFEKPGRRGGARNILRSSPDRAEAETVATPRRGRHGRSNRPLCGALAPPLPLLLGEHRFAGRYIVLVNLRFASEVDAG